MSVGNSYVDHGAVDIRVVLVTVPRGSLVC